MRFGKDKSHNGTTWEFIIGMKYHLSIITKNPKFHFILQKIKSVPSENKSKKTFITLDSASWPIFKNYHSFLIEVNFLKPVKNKYLNIHGDFLARTLNYLIPFFLIIFMETIFPRDDEQKIYDI